MSDQTVEHVSDEKIINKDSEGTSNFEESKKEQGVGVIVDSTYSTKFLYKYAWANTFKFPISLIYILVILLFIGIGVMYLVKNDNLRLLGIAFFALGLVMIPIMAALSNFSMTKGMQSQYKKYGLTGDFVLSFYFGKEIVMRNSVNKMVSVFEYKDVKKIHSILGLIIVEMKSGYRIILDKKGVKNNAVQDIKAYILDKVKEAKSV
ncbi:MAG TPA: hypothetical protein PKX91_04325 [Clostridia bacterium]|jgi:hypothetical protein|nr:hypothetical protein [Clostridia bacterium]